MLGENEIRIIKKYQNRKLYDTKDSCYITLDEIAGLIRKGEEVRVIDNKTKDDVTSIILTQILVDQEKAAKSILPLTMLRDIIQRGHGSLFDFIQRYVLMGIDSEQDKQAEAERYIDRLVVRGDLTKAEGKNLLKEVMDSTTKSQNDYQEYIAGKITSSVKDATNLSKVEKSIHSLMTKIESLEKKLNDLESR